MADTLNLNVNMENLTEEERNQLLALVKKSTEEKPKVWKPDYDEKYYFLTSYADIDITIWANDAPDKCKYAIGNCFRTHEEAEFAVEKLKVIAELKRFAQEHNEYKFNPINNKGGLYFIIYINCEVKIDYCFKYLGVFGKNAVYFTSKEIAQQAIDTIGADRLKKYYFEVED